MGGHAIVSGGAPAARVFSRARAPCPFTSPPPFSPGYMTIPAAVGSYNGGAGQISYLRQPIAPNYRSVSSPTPTQTATATRVSRSGTPSRSSSR